MSELKVWIASEVEEYDEEKIYCTELYFKSEADKVIAELKEIDSKNRSAYYKDLAMMAKDVEHQKYKRCLAMADYCYTNVHCIMGHRLCSFNDRTKEWYERWHKRWEKLAEQFKEAK